jgi:hypothetical protein
MDSDGVAHTIALPDPRLAFSEDMVDVVSSAAAVDGDRLAALIDELLESLYDRLADVDVDEQMVEVPLPRGTITGVPEAHESDAVVQVRDALLAVPPAFRLDALLATEDLLDLLGDAEPVDGDDRP